MARTDSQWETGVGGTYIQTIAPAGYDILINGTSKYLNFNTTVGPTGYGFRDNAGVMEFKDFGGSWTAVGGGTGNVTGSGVAYEVTFWNGTSSVTGDGNITYNPSSPGLTITNTLADNPWLYAVYNDGSGTSLTQRDFLMANNGNSTMSLKLQQQDSNTWGLAYSDTTGDMATSLVSTGTGVTSFITGGRTYESYDPSIETLTLGSSTSTKISIKGSQITLNDYITNNGFLYTDGSGRLVQTATVPSANGGSGVSNAGNLSWGSGGTLGSAAYTASSAYEVPLTFSTGLTRFGAAITSNLSTGISGGQSVIGGTASGNNLTLSSTSNATKGKILFGTSAYDEVNNRLGLGTNAAAVLLDVFGTGQIINMGNGTSADAYIDFAGNRGKFGFEAATGLRFQGTSTRPIVFAQGVWGAGELARFAATTGYFGLNTTTPNSWLHVNGSYSVAYIAKTANYTATASDSTINCTANTFTVTLPTAASIAGRIYTITNSGAGVITIATTSSQTFTNVAGTPTTLTLAAVGVYEVQSDGANWLVI